MIHLVVGLFKNTKEATNAIVELKASKSSNDISLIAKDEKTGNVHLQQVKEMRGEEAVPGEIRGSEIGIVGGVLLGLFIITNPEFAGGIGVLAAALGVTGATIGTLAGVTLGSLNKAGLPPERAKMYKDKIKRGEVFVSVSTSVNNEETIESIFAKHNASLIHSMTSAV